MRWAASAWRQLHHASCDSLRLAARRLVTANPRPPSHSACAARASQHRPDNTAPPSPPVTPSSDPGALQSPLGGGGPWHAHVATLGSVRLRPPPRLSMHRLTSEHVPQGSSARASPALVGRDNAGDQCSRCPPNAMRPKIVTARVVVTVSASPVAVVMPSPCARHRPSRNFRVVVVGGPAQVRTVKGQRRRHVANRVVVLVRILFINRCTVIHPHFDRRRRRRTASDHQPESTAPGKVGAARYPSGRPPQRPTSWPCADCALSHGFCRGLRHQLGRLVQRRLWP